MKKVGEAFIGIDAAKARNPTRRHRRRRQRGSHKVAGVREAIEARGASLLYLPPYSPDLVWGRSRQAMNIVSPGGVRAARSRSGAARSEGSSLSGAAIAAATLYPVAPGGAGP